MSDTFDSPARFVTLRDLIMLAPTDYHEHRGRFQHSHKGKSPKRGNPYRAHHKVDMRISVPSRLAQGLLSLPEELIFRTSVINPDGSITKYDAVHPDQHLMHYPTLTLSEEDRVRYQMDTTQHPDGSLTVTISDRPTEEPDHLNLFDMTTEEVLAACQAQRQQEGIPDSDEPVTYAPLMSHVLDAHFTYQDLKDSNAMSQIPADTKIESATGHVLASYGPRKQVGNDVVPCLPEEAEFWGVYDHDEHGHAHHVADTDKDSAPIMAQTIADANAEA